MSTAVGVPFAQVDVFAAEPFAGNPVALLDAAGSTTRRCARGNWRTLVNTSWGREPPSANTAWNLHSTLELPFAVIPRWGPARVAEHTGHPEQDEG